MPPRRAPAPYHAKQAEARDDTKAAVGVFKDIKRLMPASTLGETGGELNDRMKNAQRTEEDLLHGADIAQINKSSAAVIIKDAKAVRDQIRLELAEMREVVANVQKAASKPDDTAFDEELKESLAIVRSLIDAQPDLSRALQASLPAVDRQVAEQFEPLLERLEAAEHRLEASEQDVVRAAELYSAEEAEQKVLAKIYLDDRNAWLRERAELKTEIGEHKQEIERNGDEIDGIGLRLEITKAVAEESRAAHMESEQRQDEDHAAQMSKVKDELAAARRQLLDDANVRNRQAARIRELGDAFGNEMAALDNELSKAKHALEMSEIEKSDLQDKYDELEGDIGDIDDFRLRNVELGREVSRRNERLTQANESLAKLQVFRDTVLCWYGVNGDVNTDGLGQDFVEVVNIAYRMEDGPVMPHSLDGLQLTYAGDHPTSYDLRERMVRFWYQCRAGEIDYAAANDMLNRRLVDTRGWSAVPFLYKAFALLLERWPQVSLSSLDEVPERHVNLLLRGLLSMATLGAAFPEAVPADITPRELLTPVELHVRAWLYTNPSSLTSALLSAVRQSLTEELDPSMHHAVVLDAVIKARRDYLDSSNSDLQAGITLAVDRSRKTMVLFVDEPTTAVVWFTKQHVNASCCEDFTFSMELDPMSMKLSESTQTLRLGGQPNVSGWVRRNLL